MEKYVMKKVLLSESLPGYECSCASQGRVEAAADVIVVAEMHALKKVLPYESLQQCLLACVADRDCLAARSSQ